MEDLTVIKFCKSHGKICGIKFCEFGARMQKFISVKVSSLKVKDAIGNDSYDAKAERGIERIQSVKDSAEQVNTTLFP